MLLAGCGTPPNASSGDSGGRGRFAGIGVFDAGRLWAQMTGMAASADPAAAKIADDEHIIVVLDSHTGEVRQCGDHSGYCVAMNPWTTTHGSSATLPAKLGKHASDLAADDKAGDRTMAVERTSPDGR